MKLLKFHAPWCAPCKSLTSIFESAGDSITIPIESIDIDKEPAMAAKYGVRSIPMLFLIDEHGATIKSVTGLKTKDQLIQFLNN